MSIIPTTTRPISLDDAPEPAPAYPNRRDMYLLELEQQRALTDPEGVGLVREILNRKAAADG